MKKKKVQRLSEPEEYLEQCKHKYTAGLVKNILRVLTRAFSDPFSPKTPPKWPLDHQAFNNTTHWIMKQ